MAWKAPGFNPWTWTAISWFQAFAFKFNVLHRYAAVAAAAGPGAVGAAGEMAAGRRAPRELELLLDLMLKWEWILLYDDGEWFDVDWEWFDVDGNDLTVNDGDGDGDACFAACFAHRYENEKLRMKYG
jgi:hypothetical protein